jgi:hypothetical protein
MIYPTLTQIVAKIEQDLDLEEELFIPSNEMLGYINEAIDEAEAVIHTLYEDYFLTSASIALVAGTSIYLLPSNIYANKIRNLVYSDGTTIFPIRRLRFNDQFEDAALINTFSGTSFYRYFIINASAAAGMQIKLFPAAQETSATNVTIWYLRNANRLAVAADTCDIPEFINFVYQYVKVRCYEKEGHPNTEAARNSLEQQRQLMVDTLTSMEPDGDTTIEQDVSSYREHN